MKSKSFRYIFVSVSIHRDIKSQVGDFKVAIGVTLEEKFLHRKEIPIASSFLRIIWLAHLTV